MAGKRTRGGPVIVTGTDRRFAKPRDTRTEAQNNTLLPQNVLECSHQLESENRHPRGPPLTASETLGDAMGTGGYLSKRFWSCNTHGAEANRVETSRKLLAAPTEKAHEDTIRQDIKLC